MTWWAVAARTKRRASGRRRGPLACSTSKLASSLPEEKKLAPQHRRRGAELADQPRHHLDPGPYATAKPSRPQARLHVFIFSDNVPVADEVELKRLAAKKKLLVMGPTAARHSGPACRSVSQCVRRGRIGLSALGTGLQQVSCLG